MYRSHPKGWLFLCNFVSNLKQMKAGKRVIVFFIALMLLAGLQPAAAQCSICTKTTQQLGEKPAQGMNTGILYLAFAPLLIVGYIGYRWRKTNLQP